MNVRIPLTALLLATTAGCMTIGDHELRGRENMWKLDAVRGAALHRALIVQSTLFPYHFETGAASLNELGERDLAVLAEHLRLHPGGLSVRRGGASDDLYSARVEAVVAALVKDGVSRDMVAVSDGYPGGPGISANRLVVILEPKEESSSPTIAIPLLTQ